MFNETSYKTAWQGRRDSLPYAITATGGDDRFYAPGYGPGVVESPGFMAPGTPYHFPDTRTSVPGVDPTASGGGDTGGGGFNLGGIFSALPWWAWALGAYFLLKKR